MLPRARAVLAACAMAACVGDARRPRDLGIALLTVMTVLALAAAACGAPETTGTARRSALVLDERNLLDDDAERRVRAYLDWVLREYGVDYRVAVADLREASLEERASALYEERRTGADTGGRGLLLLVDPTAQRVRVEVGYALEPYLTDVAASRMLSDYLAPYFRAGDTAAGIEASIEALIDKLRPHLDPNRVGVGAEADDGSAPAADEADKSRDLVSADADGASLPSDSEPALSRSRSGGAGASLDLLRALPDGTPDEATIESLRSILVPQPDPRAARDLEIALLHKGIYFQGAQLYDEAWRRAARPTQWSPARLREIARQWDRPYELVIEGPRAIAYYTGAPALGPTFLRREADGWIIDASYGAGAIVYDYSNDGWYAIDDASPWLAMLRRALPLERVELQGGRAAWSLR